MESIYFILFFRYSGFNEVSLGAGKLWLECWKTSPQQYHVMRLVGETSWQGSDQSDNFNRYRK